MNWVVVLRFFIKPCWAFVISGLNSGYKKLNNVYSKTMESFGSKLIGWLFITSLVELFLCIGVIYDVFHFFHFLGKYEDFWITWNNAITAGAKIWQPSRSKKDGTWYEPIEELSSHLLNMFSISKTLNVISCNLILESNAVGTFSWILHL